MNQQLMRQMAFVCCAICVAVAVAGGCTALASRPPVDNLTVRPSVPAAIAPAIALLDSALTPAQQDTIRHMEPDSMVLLHFTLGLWLRNNGGLWHGGPVADSLRAHGVPHPDDMSSVILRAYCLHLRGEPIDLAALVRQMQVAPSGFEVIPSSARP